MEDTVAAHNVISKKKKATMRKEPEMQERGGKKSKVQGQQMKQNFNIN